MNVDKRNKLFNLRHYMKAKMAALQQAVVKIGEVLEKVGRCSLKPVLASTEHLFVSAGMPVSKR
jgi:hypothetical protein